MNIGINGTYLGSNKTGVGRYLLSLLQVWAKEETGHDFYVYCANKELLPEDKEIFNSSPNMHLRRIPHAAYPLFFHYWYIIKLPRAVKKDRIDFFFSPDYFLPPFLSGIKTSMSIHDVSYLAHPEWYSGRERLYYNYFSKKQARKTNLIFTLSEFSKKELITYIPNIEQKIHVIPLATDNMFQPGVPDKALLEQWGITQPYFLYIGKIFNRRHVPEMLEAFCAYVTQKHDSNIQFILRGENGTYPLINIQELGESINRTLQRKAIIFLPNITNNELVKLYQSAHAFFYLSDYEGFGLPILEALACGIPTITTRYSSIPEVAGDAAIYVEPSDIVAQSKAMDDLVSNQSLVEKLKEKSINQAKKFSWQRAAKETLSLIENEFKS